MVHVPVGGGDLCAPVALFLVSGVAMCVWDPL